MEGPMMCSTGPDVGDSAEKKQGPWPQGADIPVYCFMFVVVLGRSNGSGVVWPV